MQQITLASGKKTVMSINATSAKMVHGLLKLDLLDVGKEGAVEKMIDNPMTLVDVLYILCKKDCDTQKISDVEFGEGMDGDAISKATEAFLEELKNFFPQHKRAVFTHSLKMMNEMQAKGVESLMKKMDQMQPQVQEIMTAELEKRLSLENFKSSLTDQKS